MVRGSDIPTARRLALSVVVPVFNEAQTLAVRMRELTQALDAIDSAPHWELILVDDGSSDGSLGCAMRLALAEPRIALCIHDKNYGIARALATGAASAHGEFVLALDANLNYGPQQAGALWSQARTSGADIVTACAFMRGGRVRNVPVLRKYLSASANAFLALAADHRLSTFTCMTRIYRASLLRELLPLARADAVLPDLLFAAQARGARIIELPATLAPPLRKRARNRFRAQAALRHCFAILACGLARRPALAFLMAGLAALLPAMALLTFVLRLDARAAGFALAGTIFVQYASLLMFGRNAGRFRAERRSARASRAAKPVMHG